MTKKQIINPHNLGAWAYHAYFLKVNQDIFDLCLAVDIHTHLGETSFDFRGEKIDIVTPNIFIGGKLYNLYNAIATFEDSGDESLLVELFNSLEELSYDILFRDIMRDCQDNFNEASRERFYRDGWNEFIISNLFSNRYFVVNIQFPHLENNRKIKISHADRDSRSEDEPYFDNSSALANYLIEKVKDDYYFANRWSMIRILNTTNNHSMAKNDSRTAIVDTNINVIDIGPLRIVSSTDEKYRSQLVVSLNGEVIENGNSALFNNQYYEVLNSIIKDHYKEFLPYAYTNSIVKALSNNVEEIYSLEEAKKKLDLRKDINRILSSSTDVNIKHQNLSKRNLERVTNTAINQGIKYASKQIESYTEDESRVDKKHKVKVDTSTKITTMDGKRKVIPRQVIDFAVPVSDIDIDEAFEF